jgi:uncharacterized protein (TIGR02118 family)
VIKLVCFFRRNPNLTRDEFHQHWLGSHGPLIAGTPELAQHIVRYEQNHRLASDYERDEPAAPGFDGATVQWMDSMRSFTGFVKEPKYAELIAPDEAYFLDRSSLALLFTAVDDVHIDGDASRGEAEVKLCCLLKRQPETTAAAFHEHWSGPHAALFSQREALSRHILAYHQSHRLERDYDRDAGGGWDGLAEQWYRSIEEFQAMIEEPAYADVPADERRFVDSDATRFILSGRPDVIIG